MLSYGIGGFYLPHFDWGNVSSTILQFAIVVLNDGLIWIAVMTTALGFSRKDSSIQIQFMELLLQVLLDEVN